eukprot:c26842_g1_i1.p1 GENE.c26842_g1_i1~~c26842_g1_i1.p1  ORF type:complete len:176 (-),score=26.52 c26842_g1_i1:218-745(-)
MMNWTQMTTTESCQSSSSQQERPRKRTHQHLTTTPDTNSSCPSSYSSSSSESSLLKFPKFSLSETSSTGCASDSAFLCNQKTDLLNERMMVDSDSDQDWPQNDETQAFDVKPKTIWPVIPNRSSQTPFPHFTHNTNLAPILSPDSKVSLMFEKMKGSRTPKTYFTFGVRGSLRNI